MEIRNLLAEHGDAIVIKTMSDNQPYTIVIDGGPGRTDEKMASYYKRLGQIDLMVLTHFDEDHIAGIKAYFRLYKNEELPVTRFWGNCAKGIDVADNTNISDAGNRNAGTLAYYLRKQKETNESFEWREDIASPLIYAFGDFRRRCACKEPSRRSKRITNNINTPIYAKLNIQHTIARHRP